MLGFPGGGVLGTTFILGICKKGQWGRVTKTRTNRKHWDDGQKVAGFYIYVSTQLTFCLFSLLGGRFHNSTKLVPD